jgi:hypothetical protein
MERLADRQTDRQTDCADRRRKRDSKSRKYRGEIFFFEPGMNKEGKIQAPRNVNF